MDISPLITHELIEFIHSHFERNWDGIHGFAHWVRVRENGLRVAELNGANTRVVELFAFTHDLRRWNDGHDPDHGRRASAFIRSTLLPRLDLSAAELELLCDACDRHTDGLTVADLTVQTCWDADRLDLARAGIIPHPSRLCTPEARQQEIIDWAVARSRGISNY